VLRLLAVVMLVTSGCYAEIIVGQHVALGGEADASRATTVMLMTGVHGDNGRSRNGTGLGFGVAGYGTEQGEAQLVMLGGEAGIDRTVWTRGAFRLRASGRGGLFYTMSDLDQGSGGPSPDYQGLTSSLYGGASIPFLCEPRMGCWQISLGPSVLLADGPSVRTTYLLGGQVRLILAAPPFQGY
jgi:hypothetical protein